MVVRHKQDRTQIGVLEDGVLVEHYVSRETNASMAGNVYLGRIQNVLPSMEAAFVDIGKGRNAVLYAGEVNWDAAGLDNRAKRIENALSSGQGVLVQVTKDPIGHKGARLTSQVSLPGRYLVYVPDGNMMGISRKLPDTERARLKKILREVVPENAGVIVRTAAEGASEDELRADVTRLTAAWEDIQVKSKSANAPALLHGEPDLTVRVIRDVFNEDFAKLVVSGDPAWQTVSGYLNTVAPDLVDRVHKWTGEQDLFTHYRVDEQIAKAMDRKVWLPSGGTLVIDRTEAMTVVDVNTGKFVGSGGNLEETVTKNNIEAAEEVVRQLRLRDIGGIIVIDFIDMVLESNRDLVVRRLLECLGRDRTKHQVAEVTSLGLVQMTRKRVGAGLIEVFSETCEHCNGRGIIVSPDPIDEPTGDTGSGGNSGGGNKGGGNSDAGSGRGTRGRRARGTGRDASESVAPEPKVITDGPTPAQIAATAHAAAILATSPEETAAPSGEPPVDLPQDVPVEMAPPSSEPPVDLRKDVSVEMAPPSSEPPVDLRHDVPVKTAAPAKSRRRSSRSATSPAFSVPPVAVPVRGQSELVEPVTELKSFEPPVAATESAPAAEVARVRAPAARRKRPRVMSPAGPPRGAGQPEVARGEFGS
jgi:ribonuclease E